MIYIQAPHQMDVKTEDQEDAFMWWDSDLRDTSGQGIHKTIEFLKSVFTTQGPFDGVCGFSQGFNSSQKILNF